MTQKTKNLRKVIGIEAAKEVLTAQRPLTVDLKVLVQHPGALQHLHLTIKQKAGSNPDHVQGLGLDRVPGQNRLNKANAADLHLLSVKLTIM